MTSVLKYIFFSVHECLKQSHQSLIKERDRIRGTLVGSPCDETTPGPTTSTAPGQMVSNLRHTLNQALQQNMELRRRLARIHQYSDLAAFNINLNSGSGGTDGGGGGGGGGGAGGGGGGSDGEPLVSTHPREHTPHTPSSFIYLFLHLL